VSRSPRACRRALLAIIFAVLVAGCDLIGAVGRPTGGPYPDACAQWNYSARRCEAIVDRALRRAEIDPDSIQSIFLLPFEQDVSLGGGTVAMVRFELADGSHVDQDVRCVGVNMTPVCNDVAEIRTSTGVGRDTPCSGEPPVGCATLPPTPDGAAVAAAQPFLLGELDIAIDHTGGYEVRLGVATLPNGYLSERSFEIVDPQPNDFWIDDGVDLEVRPDIAGRPPIGSIFRDPFGGPEPVTIFLVFEVTDLDSPSVLQVRDIVVR
jgi:hypothetical protein